MNDQASREEHLFHQAMQLPTPEAQAEYLARSCGEDAALRQRVEALLAAARPTNDFLEQPAGPRLAEDREQPTKGGPPTTDHGPQPSHRPTIVLTVPIAEKAGDRIGHYKLLEQIGEGGCGVVYMAEQTEPIRRRVLQSHQAGDGYQAGHRPV